MAKKIVIKTTVPCNESPDCCGCLVVFEQDGLLIFECNECNKEAGRGIVREAITKTKDPSTKPVWG